MNNSNQPVFHQHHVTFKVPFNPYSDAQFNLQQVVLNMSAQNALSCC